MYNLIIHHLLLSVMERVYYNRVQVQVKSKGKAWGQVHREWVWVESKAEGLSQSPEIP